MPRSHTYRTSCLLFLWVICPDVPIHGDEGANPLVLVGKGFKIELVAIGCQESTPQWWTPRGEPIKEKPYRNDRGGKVFAQGRGVEFVFQIHKLDASEKWLISVDGATGQQTRDAESLNGQPVRVIKAFVNADLQLGTVAVSRTTGSFRKALAINGSGASSVSNGMAALAVLPPIEDVDATAVHASITIDHNAADYCLVAVDKLGVLHQSEKLRGGSANAGIRSASIYEARFTGLGIEDYVGIELHTRPYEKYEIANLPLRSGETTKLTQVFTAAPPRAKANLDWNRAKLWDWDVDDAKRHVLDLATGDFMKWDSTKEMDNQALIFAAKKKRDLVWHKSLMALRGTSIAMAETSSDLRADETVNGIKIYDDIAAEQQLLVTTPEGDRYLVVVLGSDDQGADRLTVAYRFLPE